MDLHSYDFGSSDQIILADLQKSLSHGSFQIPSRLLTQQKQSQGFDEDGSSLNVAKIGQDPQKVGEYVKMIISIACDKDAAPSTNGQNCFDKLVQPSSGSGISVLVQEMRKQIPPPQKVSS